VNGRRGNDLASDEPWVAQRCNTGVNEDSLKAFKFETEARGVGEEKRIHSRGGWDQKKAPDWKSDPGG